MIANTEEILDRIKELEADVTLLMLENKQLDERLRTIEEHAQ